MLVLDGLSLRLGGHLILDKATAALPPRVRVGLVGRQRRRQVDAAEADRRACYEADDGRIEVPSGTRIGYLAQEAPGGEATPFETVLAAATERAELLAEAEHAEDAHRIGEIHERLNAIDAHGAPARASRILAGLGFAEDAQHRPLSSFSGGWRMRVALAALLFSEPDLLLLDEPSNHLDLEAALWLESFLKSYRRSLIVVSHERDLLNNVVDSHPASRARRDHALSRQLRRVRAAEERASGASRGVPRAAGGQGQEAPGLCRSLALQGAHRAPGAEPAQGARPHCSRSRP